MYSGLGAVSLRAQACLWAKAFQSLPCRSGLVSQMKAHLKDARAQRERCTLNSFPVLIQNRKPYSVHLSQPPRNRQLFRHPSIVGIFHSSLVGKNILEMCHWAPKGLYTVINISHKDNASTREPWSEPLRRQSPSEETPMTAREHSSSFSTVWARLLGFAEQVGKMASIKS